MIEQTKEQAIKQQITETRQTEAHKQEEKIKDMVSKKYKELFKEEPRVFFAPGRVNLIGEHTDYNGGHVLPCALTIGTYAAVQKRNDDKILLYSINFEEEGVVTRNINETKPIKSFTDYPVGVVHQLRKDGFNIPFGFNVVYFGNIPNSSGLSSSASVEVLTGFFLKSLFCLELSNVQIALIGQKAENDFIGVNCGIMDQFIIAMGKEDHATYLDTSTLNFEYIPVKLKNQSLVIACSNKKRGLGESKYNERRAECEKAVEIINRQENENKIKFLGELTEEEFEQKIIEDEIIRKRAKHAVYENQRTIKACHALKNNRIEEFGMLMNESHSSLQYDYEVTGKELDTLVDASWEQEGCVGSRMTGAGFGGCTVSIVNNDNIQAFINNVGQVYKSNTDYEADFYVVNIGGGPKEL